MQNFEEISTWSLESKLFKNCPKFKPKAVGI